MRTTVAPSRTGWLTHGRPCGRRLGRAAQVPGKRPLRRCFKCQTPRRRLRATRRPAYWRACQAVASPRQARPGEAHPRLSRHSRGRAQRRLPHRLDTRPGEVPRPCYPWACARCTVRRHGAWGCFQGRTAGPFHLREGPHRAAQCTTARCRSGPRQGRCGRSSMGLSLPCAIWGPRLQAARCRLWEAQVGPRDPRNVTLGVTLRPATHRSAPLCVLRPGPPRRLQWRHVVRAPPGRLPTAQVVLPMQRAPRGAAARTTDARGRGHGATTTAAPTRHGGAPISSEAAESLASTMAPPSTAEVRGAGATATAAASTTTELTPTSTGTGVAVTKMGLTGRTRSATNRKRTRCPRVAEGCGASPAMTVTTDASGAAVQSCSQTRMKLTRRARGRPR